MPLQCAPVPKMLKTFLKISSTGCFPQGALRRVCVPGDRASSEMPVNSPQGNTGTAFNSLTQFLHPRQLPDAALSPARWCNRVCRSNPFSGNSAAWLYQVSLPRDADPSPPAQAQLGSGGCHKSAVPQLLSLGGSGLWQSWCHLVHVTACCCRKACAT